MSVADEIAADLLELESEIPASFTWNGNSYPCVTGSTKRSKVLQLDGWGQDADLIVYVRAEHFADVASRPQLKDTIIFQERSFRIDEITVPAGSPFLKLTCSDPNKGA